MYKKDIRIIINSIKDVRGVEVGEFGIHFVLEINAKQIHSNQKETCLIYVDNGCDLIEDWEQFVVNKKMAFEKSISA